MTADGGELAELFAQRDEPGPRERLVVEYKDLADRLAERFVKGRDERDDLQQAARLALLKAIDRFDVERGVQFSTFATRTIVGELKRYRRDRSWGVRVPRSLQESWMNSLRAREDLAHRLGRTPTVAEIAAEVDQSVDEVLEAMDVGNAYNMDSVDRPVGEDDGGSATVADLIGSDDPDLSQVEWLSDLAEPVAELEERERTILFLRFYHGMTQSEIAEEVGISQMHVSRLLRRTLDHLRQAGLGEHLG
jgi:RNA polymerase sigma-B factor